MGRTTGSTFWDIIGQQNPHAAALGCFARHALPPISMARARDMRWGTAGALYNYTPEQANAMLFSSASGIHMNDLLEACTS